ncbi:30S ribosomal protein S11 [Candidatus Jorgensenbacteria bacterium GWA1_49_17]|uniref:Small ribosomal subunit protein uS11 n=2 Tax=Candidatus Joergenseniibacteriota TaxID=1752739 RepID=A0A1F6BS72_9BACT|nr:MAG: 30S ribosomal protein S11 [Candidatus Jorgensenbacteria bacterium GWC1_48_12]OGG40386.1 MAG: 30S ribosomal protein S11 [Candidatus Jorgensenbacteria bacterium GWA1_49_17]
MKESEAVESTLTEKKSAAPKGKYENGRVYVQASYNNTVITATDEKGNVIAWMSAGSLGFSGPKKSTPFAASKVAEAISEKLSRSGPFKIDVFVKGVGAGRDSALRSLAGKGLNILSIKDVTPIPHNGPRPKKARRV